MWFHLSRTEWVQDAITDLRQTALGFGEPEIDRFSVAPSLGRAYLACPHAVNGDPLFSYEVHVKNPVRTTETADYEQSREHLITQPVLESEGGRIPVSLVGQVLVGQEERVELLIAYRFWELDMRDDEEHAVLWELRDGYLRLRKQREDEAGALMAAFRQQRSAGRSPRG